MIRKLPIFKRHSLKINISLFLENFFLPRINSTLWKGVSFVALLWKSTERETGFFSIQNAKSLMRSFHGWFGRKQRKRYKFKWIAPDEEKKGPYTRASSKGFSLSVSLFIFCEELRHLSVHTLTIFVRRWVYFWNCYLESSRFVSVVYRAAK